MTKKLQDDQPQGLGKLRAEAIVATGRGAHILQWAAPYHGESGSTQTGRCACGLEAYCHLRNADALQDGQAIGQVCYNSVAVHRACPKEEINYAGDTKNIGEARS